MAPIYVRVWYRPKGRAYWDYGWTFHAESLASAQRTAERVGRRHDGAVKREYRVEAVKPSDFDALRED